VIGKPRIGYAPGFEGAPVDPLIRSVVDRTIMQARSLGLDIELVSSFDLAAPLTRIWPIVSQTGVAWLMERHADWRSKVSPVIAEMATAGERYTARNYLDALDAVAEMAPAFDRFFARYDFLVTPTTAAMPWPAGQSYPPIIDGKPVGPRGHAVFTPFANALGLPAVSLPCIVGKNELPVGVQIVAARNDDWRLLSFARAYENRLFVHRWPAL
jgi:aspartyl-tRNA(Asn)/glutamyl-tRNA(Gln) amidotransferase subunit A